MKAKNQGLFFKIENHGRSLRNRKILGSAHPTLASIDEFAVSPLISSFGTFNETIRSPRTPVQSIVGIRPTPTLGISEVGIDHDGIFQIIDRPDGLEESRSSQINSLHISSSKISTFTSGSIHGGIPQISISEISSIQDRVEKTSSEQSSSGQIGETHVNHFQVSATEINSSQIGITQIGLKLPILSTSSQINPTKISLTSSITLQQLLSSHNFSLQNTTIPTQTEFLTGTTPFNLNITIADRPTTQLTAANGTSRPTSDTLTRDDYSHPIDYKVITGKSQGACNHLCDHKQARSTQNRRINSGFSGPIAPSTCNHNTL